MFVESPQVFNIMQEAHAIHRAFLTQRMGLKTERRWPGLAQQYCLLRAVMVRDVAPQPLFSQMNKNIYNITRCHKGRIRGSHASELKQIGGSVFTLVPL